MARSGAGLPKGVCAVGQWGVSSGTTSSTATFRSDSSANSGGEILLGTREVLMKLCKLYVG